MSKRTAASQMLFKKRRALKYPCNIITFSAGAVGAVNASAQQLTKEGVLIFSAATVGTTSGGVYIVHTGTASLINNTS